MNIFIIVKVPRVRTLGIIMTIDELWNSILELEGETFYTATGLAFAYEVIDEY